MISAIFDDAELAVFDARRMVESGRYPGIRVVHEEFDDVSGDVTSQIIFRGSKYQRHNNLAVSSSASVIKTAMADRRVREAAKVVRRIESKKKKLKPVRMLVILFALGGMAIGGLIGVQVVAEFFR